MRILLARILWLKGHASRASAMAMEALRFSEADVGYSRCQAIALAACPIALWSGDLNAAKAFADTLIEQSHVHRLPYWKSWAENFLAVASDGDKPVVDPNDAKQLDMFGTFGPRYLHPSSLARVESGAVGWCAPEVLRARGQQLALGGDEQRRLADDFFAKSCRLARQQGAIAWEVRATTSRCRLLQALGRPDSAREQLHSVLQRIDASEGSSDLADALALQGELA